MKFVPRAMATLVVAVLLAATSTDAAVSEGRPGYGLIGYGITMYSPRCAYSCQASVPTTLQCPDDHHHHGDMEMEGMSMMPSPECLATNPPYLRSLAWCIHTHCGTDVADIPALEEWWVLNVPGRNTHQPVPNITYQEAVERVDTPPTDVLGQGEVLNRTVAVDEDTYFASDNIFEVFEDTETLNSTMALVVFVTGAVIPIVFSLLRFFPWPAAAVSKFHSLFIDPPAFGSRHAMPINNLATVPTRGQAIFIAYLIAINVITNAAGFRLAEPNTWYPTSWYQVAVYVSNRTGATSFANIPLLILFSSRNNVLLWLTDWSHSTFLLLHRYVAWLCALEACIHSAIYLHLYLWKQTHAEEATLAYWYWGIIGTLALALLLPLSVRPFRSAAYELFRVGHIILAILAIVGSWYHIIERYEHQWGYETWLYMAMAVWAFDRVARVARILRNGVHRAYVSRIDGDYVRVDVPGVDAHGHTYVYFPTLSWRIWENHPFSVVGSIEMRESVVHSPAEKAEAENAGAEKRGPILGVRSSSNESGPLENQSQKHSSAGITLFVRVHAGATSRLVSKIGRASGIPILVEASYGHESSGIFASSSTAPSRQFPNTVCIAGGVGITAVLPSLSRTLNLHAPLGSTKLFWGVRSQGLVDAVESLITDIKTDPQTDVRWWSGRIEAHVAVGERLDVRRILDEELASGKGTMVIVSGPVGMADDVRNIVSGLGRGNAVVRFVEESFTW